jgi:hypothetical protein
MDERTERTRLRSGRFDRWITAGAGVLFVGIAVTIVVESISTPRLLAWLAALVIGALGVDAVVGAVLDRRCLLSRIGPLP